jgi:DNA polymerase-3 subunit alpha
MIKAGTFDSLAGGKRAALLEALPGALEAAGQTQNDRRHGQGSLFADVADQLPAAAATSGVFKDIPEWSPSERLKYEKEALDFYISSHPLAQVGDAIQHFASHTIGRLGELDHNNEVFVGGMFAQVRIMNTKKPGRNGNSRYVRCKLEDFTGNVECVMWPDDYVQFKDLIAEDRICFVQGYVEKRTDQPVLLMTKVLTIEQGKKERTTGLLLVMDAADDPAKIDAINQALRRSPRGSTPVFLYLRDAAGKYAKLKASDDLRINPENVAKTDLEMILGPGRVEFARTNGRSS